MKKRFLLPLIGAGALTGLFFIGQSGIDQDIAACNAGNDKICVDMANRLSGSFFGIDKITNPAFAEARKEVKAKAQAVAAAKPQPKLWQPTPYNVSMLSLACENRLKPNLKDPRSFRRLDEGVAELTDSHVTIRVAYTATNSFGGRVQNTHDCTYTR